MRLLFGYFGQKRNSALQSVYVFIYFLTVYVKINYFLIVRLIFLKKETSITDCYNPSLQLCQN